MPLNDVLQLALVPASRLPGGDTLLGGFCFGPADGCAQPGLPLLGVNMPALAAAEPMCEVWQSAQPLLSGQHGRIRYRCNDVLLFGVLELEEAADAACPPLQSTTQAAYQSIFELLETRGYGAVLRFWNYFPAINQESHGIERYRQFNVGRQDAFLAQGRAVIGNVPAACALGSGAGGLQIAFLAARAEVAGIENPRQLSAYRYPSQYGPRSPTFSRAGLVRLGGRDLLFISGTASIVGHQTLHRGDARAQTRESLANIAAVVAEANRLAPDAGFRLEGLAYKVYLRHPDDLDAVRHELTHFIGTAVAAIFLQADVCRAELLVEIEASGGHAILAHDV